MNVLHAVVLYISNQKIASIVRDTQARILPKGIKAPLFVTAKDAELPAVTLEIGALIIENVFQQTQTTFMKDKAVVNGYFINEERIISGSSVMTYYCKLQRGQGHTTRVLVYGSFSINIKSMLNRVLCDTIPDFATLYESGGISTLTGNLNELEVDRMIQAFDANHKITKTIKNFSLRDSAKFLMMAHHNGYESRDCYRYIFRYVGY